jgi:hypothetical protein
VLLLDASALLVLLVLMDRDAALNAVLPRGETPLCCDAADHMLTLYLLLW